MLRYAITDGSSNPKGFSRLAQRCAELADDGVNFVLIREKHLAPGDLATLARNVLAAVRNTGSGTRILIAQRVDIAIATDAGGVHLSAQPGELTPMQVRQLMPQAFVSVSCHTLEEVRRAHEQAASAILFSPVFGKTIDEVEVVPAIGLLHLHEACLTAGTTPVFALGGVTLANAASCLEAGAAGIAAIRLFLGAP